MHRNIQAFSFDFDLSPYPTAFSFTRRTIPTTFSV